MHGMHGCVYSNTCRVHTMWVKDRVKEKGDLNEAVPTSLRNNSEENGNEPCADFFIV